MSRFRRANPVASEAPEVASAPPGVVLIRIDGGQRVYQCVGGYRVPIESAQAFLSAGFRWEWVQDVSSSDPLALLPILQRSQGSGLERARTAGYPTFAEYLALAVCDPELIRSPFTEEDRRVLTHMAWRRERLAAEQADLPQDDLVSVILVGSGDRPAEDATDSALAQTYRNIEVILVGASAGAAAWGHSKDARIKPLDEAASENLAAALNIGLRAATGEWIAYLRTGSTWHPDHLRILIGELRRGGAAMGYGARQIVRAGGLDAAQQERVISYAPFHRGLLENICFLSLPALVHRRELLDEVGYPDASAEPAAEWDFILRLTAAQRPLGVPAVLCCEDQAGPGEGAAEAADSAGSAARRRIPGEEPLTSVLPELTPLAERTEGLEVACTSPTRAPAATAAPPVTVVIPSYEAAPYLKACMSALRAFSPPRTRVAIIDNASGPDVQRLLDDLERTERVRVVRNDVNMGFTHAVNQGIDLAEPGDDIVILNNDALVTPGWLDALQRVSTERPDVGMVAPMQVLLPGTPTMQTHVPAAYPGRECDTNLSAHHRNVIDPTFDERRGWVELDYAPFFCVLVTGRALERCGRLDHVHAPHYRSDRVYCDAVRMHAGMRIVYTPEAKVYHFHERSTEALHAADDRLAKAMRTSQTWQAIVGLQKRQGRPAESR